MSMNGINDHVSMVSKYQVLYCDTINDTGAGVGASMTGAGAGHMCITAQLPAPVDNGRKCAVTSYRSQPATRELMTGPHFVQSLARSPLPPSRFQIPDFSYPRRSQESVPPSSHPQQMKEM